MEENRQQLFDRIDEAFARITACFESKSIEEDNRIKTLTAELSAEREKVRSLESRLREFEDQSKEIALLRHESANLREARSADLEELASVMADLKPIIEGSGSVRDTN